MPDFEILSGLPEKYIKNAHIAMKPLLTATTNSHEKKRLKENLLDVNLVWQIDGFDIPNYLSEEYACQAILYLEAKISGIKNADFVGTLLQKAIKELCIIKFYDGEKQCFCFAQKRFNKINKNEIVADNFYFTDFVPLKVKCEEIERLEKYLVFSSIINRENKAFFYAEILTKAFICFNPRLFKKLDEFLKSLVWHKADEVNDLFAKLQNIKLLKTQFLKTAQISDKSIINTKIKSLIKALEEML